MEVLTPMEVMKNYEPVDPIPDQIAYAFESFRRMDGVPMPQIHLSTASFRKPKYIEALEKELIRQQELTVTPVIVKLAPGEEDTTELLRSLGEESMERSLNEKKIRSVTINCEDGTTFEGRVTRMMGCPYDISSQELTVKIGKPTGNYGIKEVIFQNPTTIVFWTDGTKTVVNCMDNVEMKKKIVDGKEVTVKKPRFSPNFSKETGLAMAIAKKWAGNQGNYNDIFRKYIDEVE